MSRVLVDKTRLLTLAQFMKAPIIAADSDTNLQALGLRRKHRIKDQILELRCRT